ncbi:protein dispatched homolog 3-like [Anneissia japonica]|uniref:protein dispatched homolog 3-like n=1 Tax=Anneissia japonica TaxID=1529436 RepID=UPI001425798B|nr:protein dispatched homolog 3-like [Anneissia japonica]
MEGIQITPMSELHQEAENGTDNPAYLANNADTYNEKNASINKPTPKFTKSLSDVKSTRGKKPMWWCNFIVSRPKTAFGITLGGHILILLITAGLVYFDYNIFPDYFTDLPLDIRNDEQFKRGIAWDRRDNNFLKVYRTQSNEVHNIRTADYDSLEVIFFQRNGNVFSKENLVKIQDFERELINMKDFDKYCRLDGGSNSSCLSPSSVIRFFDGSYVETYGNAFYDPQFDNISAVLNAALLIPDLQEIMQYFLEEDSVVNSEEAISELTRLVLDFGTPLDNISEALTFEDEPNTEIDKYIDEYFQTFLSKKFESGLGDGLEITYFSRAIYVNTINSAIYRDLALIVGSFVFIVLFIYFQTRSWWITGFSVFSIITSFLCANLFYRVVLGYEFFGIFHILAIFILLGIGADDVFIFVDTWRATGLLSYPSLAHRLSDSYRRAATAMLVTSLTTASAFFVNFFSPFFCTSSFGLFSSLMIVANYLSVIIYFPTVLITYHTYWKDCRCCCCACCYPKDDGTAPRANIVVRFFSGPFFKLVTNKICRWVIIVMLLSITAFLSYMISTIESTERDVQIFPDSHFIEQHTKRRYRFKDSVEGDDIVELYVVFGIKTVDLSVCQFTEFECFGNTVYDDSFDMNSPQNQQALLDFCTYIRDLDTSKTNELWIRRSVVTGKPELRCFVENMKDYFEDDKRNISFPLTYNGTLKLIEQNPDVYNNSLLTTDDRLFEIGLAYWLTDGHKEIGLQENDYSLYHGYLGEEAIGNTFKISSGESINTRLKYAAIVINTTMIWGDFGYQIGLPLLDTWEKFIKERMSEMPEGVNKGYQCTPAGSGYNFWLWMKIQEELTNSAIRSIAIGISVAFVVLVLTTQNFIIGFLATITICCITACVMGLIPIIGWTLGTLESLNLSLVVGLSVDYVVHLAEGYHMAQSKDRMGKTKEMLQTVGISVLSGCLTTLGACFFMLFSVITFFLQFGSFVFCTIGLSYIFSMFLFTAMMSIVGPENNCGSIQSIFCCFRSKP